jgi:hypothetical protein
MIKVNSYTTSMIKDSILLCESITKCKLKLVKESDKPYYLINDKNNHILTSGTKKEILNFIDGFNKLYLELVKIKK